MAVSFWVREYIQVNDVLERTQDFPGGPVVKNPQANSQDSDSIPGPGRFHLPQAN